MGTFFTRTPLAEPNMELINYLKQIKISEINEAIEIYNSNYPFAQALTIFMFKDIFEGILSVQTETLFKQLENTQSLKKEVDLYETLAVLVTFSDGEYSIKLKYIYELFDFDKSGIIDRKELKMSMNSAIRSLCKLVNIKFPSVEQLENFINLIFMQMDTNFSNDISFAEFSNFMNNSVELHDFLLKYASIQTFPNAQRRLKLLQNKFTNIWKTLSKDDTEEVNCQDIVYNLKEYLDGVESEYLTKLFLQLSDGENKIDQAIFKDIMHAIASFQSTDINNDKKIDKRELKYLLYAFENEEPTDFRVNQEYQDILSIKEKKKQNNNEISLDLWVQFVYEPKGQGFAPFRLSLRRLFEQYDKDNSGRLDRKEIEELLLDFFKELRQKFQSKSESEIDVFNKEILQLSHLMLKNLNSKSEQDFEISWLEFKYRMQENYQNIDEVKKFLDSFFL